MCRLSKRMKRHHSEHRPSHRQSSTLAYAKEGHLDTKQSDNSTSDSDLDDLDDPSTEQETLSSATVESEAQPE